MASLRSNWAGHTGYIAMRVVEKAVLDLESRMRCGLTYYRRQLGLGTMTRSQCGAGSMMCLRLSERDWLV